MPGYSVTEHIAKVGLARSRLCLFSCGLSVPEGQDLLIVCHIEPTFAPNYCSPGPELRLDHVYMLPIEPVVFEWPAPVTSAATAGY